jgi:hypothetical protein
MRAPYALVEMERRELQTMPLVPSNRPVWLHSPTGLKPSRH